MEKFDSEKIESEFSADNLINDLREAIKLDDKDAIIVAMQNIGDMVHAAWGTASTPQTVFDKVQERCITYLSTGTGGTRLMIDDSGDLIFPNVNLDCKKNGKTLADAFEEVFKEKAQNIQGEDNPYYIVKLE